MRWPLWARLKPAARGAPWSFECCGAGKEKKVHAALKALLFPRQKNQIRQNLVAKNSTPPGRRLIL
jgi:hypothetical protein